MQAHLVLLRAFQELRSRVTKGTDDTLPQYTPEAVPPSANVKDDSIQFVLFLHRALFRFERYVSVILAPLYTQAPLRFSQLAKANGPDTGLLPPHMLPPLDVAFLWRMYRTTNSRFVQAPSSALLRRYLP